MVNTIIASRGGETRRFRPSIATARRMEHAWPMDVSLRCPITADAHIPLDVLTDIIGAELFALGATAIGEEQVASASAGAESTVLTAGFESELAARRALDRLTTRHPTAIGETTVARSPTDWMVSQRAGLAPTQIGPWHIRAPWDPQPTHIDSTHDVVVDPGAAFGHGAHPSTVLAIELLIRRAKGHRRLIDVGTGTGVIAIISARLGMMVEAIESDHVAAEVARHNIDRNATYPHDDVNELITLTHEDAATRRPPDSDSLVLANVTIDVHRMIAPVYRSASTLILSGLLCRQVTEAAALYPQHEARTIRTHGEWAGIELVRAKRLSEVSTG